MKQVKK
ncbi:hypothetical protein F383_12157 [Gossypium arboreum]|nr:hypothetical protein F383_12157 [Gossypium arboreum]